MGLLKAIDTSKPGEFSMVYERTTRAAQAGFARGALANRLKSEPISHTIGQEVQMVVLLS